MRALRYVNKVLRRAGYKLVADAPTRGISAPDLALIKRFAPYTMTSTARQNALIRAVRHIDRRGIPGDIVECGVWLGGAMMLAKASRVDMSIERKYHLYDTFTGMSEPTEVDTRLRGGETALERFRRSQADGYTDWCYGPLEHVQENFRAERLHDDSLVWHVGKVEDTLIQEALPGSIALLRLDTDWYQSTSLELRLLYPLVSPGGVIIFDDYGCWAGARKAVDEFLEHTPLMLFALDDTGYATIKA